MRQWTGREQDRMTADAAPATRNARLSHPRCVATVVWSRSRSSMLRLTWRAPRPWLILKFDRVPAHTPDCSFCCQRTDRRLDLRAALRAFEVKIEIRYIRPSD